MSLIVNNRQTLLGLTELGRYCDHHHAGQPRQKISDPSLTLFVKVISFSWNSSVLAWLVLEGGYSCKAFRDVRAALYQKL